LTIVIPIITDLNVLIDLIDFKYLLLDAYFIYKCNESTGILIRVNKPLVVEKHLLLTICNAINLVVNKEKENNSHIDFILIHKNYSKSYVFNKRTPLIRFGSSQDNEIHYELEGVSKIHCW